MRTDDFYADLERQLLAARPRPPVVVRAVPLALAALVAAALAWSVTSLGNDEQAAVPPATDSGWTPYALEPCPAGAARDGSPPERLLSAFAGLRDGEPADIPAAFRHDPAQAVEYWPDAARVVGRFGSETYYLIAARVFARRDIEASEGRCRSRVRAGAESELGACLLATHPGGAQFACETLSNIRAGAILIDLDHHVAGLAVDGVTSFAVTRGTSTAHMPVDSSLWRTSGPADSARPAG